MFLPLKTSRTGFRTWREECRAIRERAVLIDQTSFAKFEITGAGTEAALQRIAANDLSGPPGKAVYTQLCNEKGGIEADVTLVHVGPDHFYLITGSGFGVRDSGWVAKHLPPSVQIRDVTNALAVINICGPRSRDILQSVTDADISNAAFPFFGARRIDVGHATVLAVRVGYVGELGYELYIPQEFGAHVYDTLWAAGAAHGIANAGYRAIDSCRMEKGYLYWSGDISPDYNPYEAGLGFCVALDKGDFIGREALAKIKAARPFAEALFLHHRRFCTAPWRRDHSTWRESCGLDHERRLRPYARQDHRFWLSSHGDRRAKGLRHRSLRQSP